MDKIRKIFPIEVKERRENGGKIRITTSSVDRDKDRVFSSGARVADYMANPVVQWAHNYRDPWATIGNTNALEIGADFIDADFDLRPAANDSDPQNIVRLLWNGGWIKTASIGFMPDADDDKMPRNDLGGTDFKEWDLLEWSLVPVPANQEALRLAVKGLVGEGNTSSSNVSYTFTVSNNLFSDPGDETDAVDPTPEVEVTEEPNTDDPSHDASDELTDDELDALTQFANSLQEIFNG